MASAAEVLAAEFRARGVLPQERPPDPGNEPAAVVGTAAAGGDEKRKDSNSVPDRAHGVTNDAFLRTMFHAGETAWVCAFGGNPQTDGRWGGRAHVVGDTLNLPSGGNTYFATAVLTDGAAARRKSEFARLAVLVADDADSTGLAHPPSWILRTSPGKRQVGYILSPDDPATRNIEACEGAVRSLQDMGLVGQDRSGNNVVRYVRLPVGRNGKYQGNPAHVLDVWEPSRVYTLAQALQAFGVAPARDVDHDDLAPAAGDRRPGTAGLDVVEAERQIADGSALHEPVIRLIGRFLRKGLHESEVIDRVRGQLSSSKRRTDADPERRATWQARFDDVPRIVHQTARNLGTAYALKEDFSDRGNANVLARLTRGDLRYVFETKTWIYWTGRRWEPDPSRVHVARQCERVAEHWGHQAAQIETKLHSAPDTTTQKAMRKQADPLRTWEKRTRSKAGVDGMLGLATMHPTFVISQDALDTNPLLLGVQNGVVDLRTGKLRPDARNEFVTLRAAVDYDHEAKAPRFLAFIDEVTGVPLEPDFDDAGVPVPSTVGRYQPRPDYARYQQVMLGYTVTGDTSAQCMFVAHGEGSNGKSLLVDTVVEVLGDYATSAPPELLMTSKAVVDANRATPAIAALRGKRLVKASEPRHGAQFDPAVVKALTGDRKISGRALYDRMNSSMPITFKLLVLANQKPTLEGVDAALAGRFQMPPFDRRFNRPGEDRDPALPDADPGLAAALRAESKGILAWLVAGAVEYLRGGLPRCEAVQASTRQYLREQDAVVDWLAEFEPVDPAKGTLAGELYRDLMQWATGQGRSFGLPTSVKALSSVLARQKVNKLVRRDGTAFGLKRRGTTTFEDFDLA